MNYLWLYMLGDILCRTYLVPCDLSPIRGFSEALPRSQLAAPLGCGVWRQYHVTCHLSTSPSNCTLDVAHPERVTAMHGCHGLALQANP